MYSSKLLMIFNKSLTQKPIFVISICHKKFAVNIKNNSARLSSGAISVGERSVGDYVAWNNFVIFAPRIGVVAVVVSRPDGEPKPICGWKELL